MAELLAPIAAKKPDEAALIDEHGSTTWAELDVRVNRLMHALRDLGVGKGDVMAALCANTREYYEIFLAASHGGFLVAPVNWHWVADELSYVLEDSGAKVLVADARFADVALAATERRSIAKVAVGGPIEGFAEYEEVLAAADPSEPEGQAAGGPMFFTSGTTGRPKGVRNSMFANSEMPVAMLSLIGGGLASSMGMPAGGRSFLNGPLYHSAQWAFTLLPMFVGSSVVMRHKFDPAETLQVIDDHQVTNIHLVPTQFIRMLKLPDDVKASFRGDSLQIVWHGAAPCPPDVKRAMIDWWGPKIVEYYGGTEASIVSVIDSKDWLDHPTSVGKPMATVEVLVLDEHNEPCPPGVSGALYFRSLLGSDFEYHGDPEKTAKAHLAPGVYTLGDVGYLDDEGWLHLSDRKIDMIISGGVNIYPAEIEGVLVSHPAVRDAAVFGIPNEEFGEEVKGAVELNDGFEATDELVAGILSFCRQKLAGYKVPRSLDVEDALPRQPTGKLYKRLLRDRYWQGTGRSI